MAARSQVAEEYQLLLTAEAMGSSKPTTRRRHGVTPDDKSKKAPDQVRPVDCSYLWYQPNTSPLTPVRPQERRGRSTTATTPTASKGQRSSRANPNRAADKGDEKEKHDEADKSTPAPAAAAAAGTRASGRKRPAAAVAAAPDGKRSKVSKRG